MNRRDTLRSLLALGAVVAPLRSLAQGTSSPARVVVVHLGTANQSQSLVDASRDGLRELGYVIGRDVIIEERFADNQFERLPAIFRDVVASKPQVIVTGGSQGAWAAKAATSTIPIVIASIASPVEQGLVASLARPGGNITGIAILEEVIGAKALETLRVVMPTATRVVGLRNPTNRSAVQVWPRMEEAARKLGFELLTVEVASPDQFEAAFATIVKLRPHVLRVGADALFIVHRERILQFAANHRLPTLVPDRPYVVDGGLIGFNSPLPWRFFRAAHFVDRILKGAQPAELPFEQPTKFEMLVNVKTAKALGLTIPQAVLLRADEVIE